MQDSYIDALLPDVDLALTPDELDPGAAGRPKVAADGHADEGREREDPEPSDGHPTHGGAVPEGGMASLRAFRDALAAEHVPEDGSWDETAVTVESLAALASCVIAALEADGVDAAAREDARSEEGASRAEAAAAEAEAAARETARLLSAARAAAVPAVPTTDNDGPPPVPAHGEARAPLDVGASGPVASAAVGVVVALALACAIVCAASLVTGTPVSELIPPLGALGL